MKQTIRKGFKFRLKPTADQRKTMTQYSEACRFVWNKARARNIKRLEAKQPILWYNEMSWWITFWRKSEEMAFLSEAHSGALHETVRALDRAFKDGFDKNQPHKRIPKSKPMGQYSSFKYTDAKTLKLNQSENTVYLPKIGWVKYRNSRQVIGDLKNVTVSFKGGHWYVSIQTEYEADIPRHDAKSMIGIDMGVKKFITWTDGKTCDYKEPLNSFKKLEKKLAFEQRKLSRKVRFSANWKKQKAKITKLHERIANARHDFLQKTSSELSKNHAMIVVEDLKVKNMSKSAKGDLDNPGKNVKAKSGLNKSILDQGWGMFVSMLEYKQTWNGGDLIKVDPRHTSQTCPCCGHVSKENRTSQEKFACTQCGAEANADVVGAVNVLERGYRSLACGEDSLEFSVKQELMFGSDIKHLHLGGM